MEQDACAGRLVVSTLLKDLPASLDLTHYFDGQPEVDDALANLLKTHPSNLVAGEVGQIMARYGIAMTTIIDVLYAISSVIRKYQRDNRISEDFTVTLGDITQNAPPTIARGDILDHVVSVTDLDPEVAQRLLTWLYAVAEIKPKIIQHFIYQHDQVRPGGIDCCYVNQLYEMWSYIRK